VDTESTYFSGPHPLKSDNEDATWLPVQQEDGNKFLYHPQTFAVKKLN